MSYPVIKPSEIHCFLSLPTVFVVNSHHPSESFPFFPCPQRIKYPAPLFFPWTVSPCDHWSHWRRVLYFLLVPVSTDIILGVWWIFNTYLMDEQEECVMNKQSINLADCSWPYLHICVKKALSHINFNLFSWRSIIHSFNHSHIHCTISWVSTASQTPLKVLPHKSIENNPLMTVPFTVCWWERRTCGRDQCQKREWGYSYIDAHTHITKLCLSKVLFITLLITLKYTTRKQVTHKIKLAKTPVWAGEVPI